MEQLDLAALRNLPNIVQQMSDEQLEMALQELALLLHKLGIVADLTRHSVQAAILAGDPPEITEEMLIEGGLAKVQAKAVVDGYSAVWREASRRDYAQRDMSQD